MGGNPVNTAGGNRSGESVVFLILIIFKEILKRKIFIILVGVFLLSGCVNKKPLPWPPVDETQEMPVYLYGPIYEVSSAPKTGKHFALLKKVILEIVEHPEKYLPQEYLERISGIGYEHYFDTLVQSDEWSTIKGMGLER